MSNNRLVFDGLAELRAQLRALPAELAGEASHIVEGAANSAAAEIGRGYHRGKTGNLIDGLRVTHLDAGKYSAGSIVKNTSPHAWIYENGTQVRHTAIGANRGAMPPGHVFIPAVMRARKRMYAQLKELLVRAGLVVSGG